MLLHVDEVKLSKTGKSYSVKSGDTYYTCKAKGIEQSAGKQIEAVLGSYDFNGRSFPTIDGFTYVDIQGTPGEAPRASNGDRWWLPFVSNQVAHAIAAGLIKDPVEVGTWAKALRNVIQAVDAEGADDLPF